jgi:predicted permease
MSGWSGFGTDVRVAIRGLIRAPAFTLTALAVLAVAVTVNAAVFAFVRGTLLERPPYREPEALVLAWGSEPINGQRRDVISGSNFIDLRTRTTTLASLAAFHGDEVIWMRDGRPEVLSALEVTVDFLRVLGVEPIAGRDFGPQDRFSGAPASALVSHAFWQEALGGRADLVGTRLEIGGALTTIAGVLPAGFRFAGEWPLYVPLRDDELAAEDRTHHHYHMVGRLRPGVGPAAASQELTAILADIAARDPRLARWSILVEPMQDVTVEAVRPALWLSAAAVLLVLAVAIVNLGTLLRIRTLERLTELSVRAALGAPAGRLAAALLIEAVTLSAAGGALGVLLAPAALDLLASLAPAHVVIPGSAASVPVLRSTLDVNLLLAVIAAALVAGVLLAVPSLLSVRRDVPLAPAAGSGHRVTRGRGSRWLVGAEVALATVLAAGAGLTIRSAWHLASRDTGVVPEGVLTAYFGDVEDLPAPQRAEYYRLVLAAVEAIPGVVRAGTKDYRPFEGEDDFQGLRFPDRPPPLAGQGPREEWRRVSEGYFDTVGMKILRGRGFERGDFAGTPRAVVVNQAFAVKHYPGQDPVGRRLRVAEPGYTDVEIVGVVGDVLSRGVTEPAPPVLYAPYQASPRGHVALFVKVAGDPTRHADAVRDAIWSVDPSQPVMPTIPLDEVVRQSMAIPTMMSRLVSATACLALVLAALGVFGIVGFAVRARTRELGVRMALGATAARVTREVVGGFAPTLLLSLVAGVALAAGGLAGLRAQLHGVEPTDPIAFAAAAGVMAAASLVAAWLPARRVARLDPAEVIRHADS